MYIHTESRARSPRSGLASSSFSRSSPPVPGRGGAGLRHEREPPRRPAGRRSVQVTQNVAALVVENLCNKDTVNLHGQLVMTTATTPTSNGGLRIVSSDAGEPPHRERIAPPPAYGYLGSDNQDSYSYIAPPPYPTTYSERHWTKLTPQVNAPAMWLVVVTREVITADGTAVPAVERAYLTCSQPSSRDCHRES